MLGQTHKQSSCCLILLPFLHRESIQLVAIQLAIIGHRMLISCYNRLQNREQPTHASEFLFCLCRLNLYSTSEWLVALPSYQDQWVLMSCIFYKKCTQLYMDFGVAEEVEWKHLTDNLHHCFIASEQGIVNAQFCHIQTLKTEEEPDHVVRLINTYSIDVESILFELGSYIDLPDVDFSKLAALAQQVEERSSLMGAEHMRLACADLIQACRQMDKRNLSLSFNWIKNEFAHIRTKLEVIVQMKNATQPEGEYGWSGRLCDLRANIKSRFLSVVKFTSMCLLGRTLENIDSNSPPPPPPRGIEEIGQVLVFLGESCDDSIRTKKHNIFRLVNETIHGKDIITKRAYRRRATYGLQTPVHELRPRLGPIDTSSGWQVFGFVLSNLRGNGKMHVDEQVSHRIF
ncbi:hypothetical protein NC653_023749 [Populus alba x Populus x berolinensis]|uniref:Histidine-containing phosphotransfer protein n=1 Tax=Populus alba x Populus x berolinensis TaxID=444605 RepID=A0AAD6QB22_9ROSI|nr:hypothetical protein NC653_023749 [Populus alba x Populus x berolinensis]